MRGELLPLPLRALLLRTSLHLPADLLLGQVAVSAEHSWDGGCIDAYGDGLGQRVAAACEERERDACEEGEEGEGSGCAPP